MIDKELLKKRTIKSVKETFSLFWKVLTWFFKWPFRYTIMLIFGLVCMASQSLSSGLSRIGKAEPENIEPL